MLRKCRVVICCTMLFLFVSTALAQSSKIYGPEIQTMISDFRDTHYLYGELYAKVTGDRHNPIVTLTYKYTYSDWLTGEYRDESFSGVIPSSSLTWSGVPEYNSNVTATLRVDTSTIGPSPEVVKTGTGGLIEITWTQDPTQNVYSTTGENTTENSSYIERATGKVTWTKFKFDGTLLDRPVSDSMSYWSAIYFFDYTVTSRTQK